jgi:hypothetical protein
MTIHATLSGPVVTLDCIGVLAEEDLDTLFKAFDRARKAGPFVVITDTTRMKSASREIIGSFASRLKQGPPLTNVWLGDAVVISSSAVRFIVSTLLIVAPMPTEVKVFETASEAKRWSSWILRRAGLSAPAAPA